MSKRPLRNHTPAFNAKVTSKATRGERTLAELAQQFDVHVNQITSRKGQLLEGTAGIFGSEPEADRALVVDVKTFYAKFGELTLTNDSLSGAFSKAGFWSPKRLPSRRSSSRSAASMV